MLSPQKVAQISQKYGTTHQNNNIGGREAMPLEACVDACYTHMNLALDIMDDSDKGDRIAIMTKLIKAYTLEKTPKVAEFMKDDVMQYALLEEFLTEKITEFDILTKPLYDEGIDEIRINDHRSIFVEKGGKTKHLEYEPGVPVMFDSADELLKIINKLLKFSQERLVPKTPMVSTSTSLGYRISASHSVMGGRDLPPYNQPDFSCVIRKFKEIRFTERDYIEMGTFGNNMFLFMCILPLAKFSVLTVGETGSGKSSTNELICKRIPDDDRTILMQNPTEVRIIKRDQFGRMINDVVMWEVKDFDDAKKTDPTYYNATMHAYRYTPVKMVYGEIRRSEEFTIALTATMSGHDVIATGHAGGAEDMVYRYIDEVKSETKGDTESIMINVCNKMKFIITQNRYVDGSRKVAEITEVQGTIVVNGVMKPNLVPIFKFIHNEQDSDVNLKVDLTNLRNKEVSGRHYYCNPISAESRQKLLNAGISKHIIEIFCKPVTNPITDTYDLDMSKFGGV